MQELVLRQKFHITTFSFYPFFFSFTWIFFVKLVQIFCKGKFELLFMQFIKGDSLTLTVIFFSSSDSIENAKWYFFFLFFSFFLFKFRRKQYKQNYSEKVSKKTEAIQTEFWEWVENSLSQICWTWQRHHKPWSSLTSRTVKSENHWLNLIHNIQLFIPICTAVNQICCTENWIWQSSTRTSTYNVNSNKKQRKLLYKKKNNRKNRACSLFRFK